MRMHAEQGPLREKLLKVQNELEEAVKNKWKGKANLQKQHDLWKELYYDVAAVENDRLHRKLAKYKRMAGKTHFAPLSYPMNKLTHERKMMAHACRDIALGWGGEQGQSA